MRVKCIKNRGTQISNKYVEARLALSTTKYGLNIGEEFNVYGIMVKKGLTLYLIAEGEIYGVGFIPTWLPADLFVVTNSKLPPFFYYTYFHLNQQDPISLLGYKELVEDVVHYDRLIECDSQNDIDIFQKRKIEIDEECSNS